MTSYTGMILEGFLPQTAVGSYEHVPFEMPAGVARLEVSYEYDAMIGSDPHLAGGNTLDIGIFDPRGIEFPGGGFRGWSGSSKQGFSISPAEATPSYLAGPLQPGTWHLCLGLYKSAPEGCRYRITLYFHWNGVSDSAFPPLLALESAPASRPAHPDGWYRGELHCHSHHSDGDSSPTEVIAAAEALGLDFLALTDHNDISHLAALAALGQQNLVLIPGYEVTTYKGHWNVWGLGEWIDFRNPTPERLEQTIRYAVQRGYLTSCNHPRRFGPTWDYPQVGGFHCVEVWNGPWELFNTEALAFWEERLREGQRLVAVGGSDTHFLHREHHARLGVPATWIYCPGDLSAAGLLAGLRAGHVFVTHAPDGPQIYLWIGDSMMGDVVPRPDNGSLEMQVRVVNGKGLRLELHSSRGCVYAQPVVSNDETNALKLDAGAALYFYAQLRDPSSGAMRALTNPLYLE